MADDEVSFAYRYHNGCFWRSGHKILFTMNDPLQGGPTGLIIKDVKSFDKTLFQGTVDQWRATPVDVKEIVKDYLTRHGLDGLSNDCCGCGVDDLAPCGEMKQSCRPARAVTGTCGDCKSPCDCADGDDAVNTCYFSVK